MKKLSLIFGILSLFTSVYWLYRAITHVENNEMEWLIFSLFLLVISIYGVIQNTINYTKL